MDIKRTAEDIKQYQSIINKIKERIDEEKIKLAYIYGELINSIELLYYEKFDRSYYINVLQKQPAKHTERIISDINKKQLRLCGCCDLDDKKQIRDRNYSEITVTKKTIKDLEDLLKYATDNPLSIVRRFR